MHSHLAEVSSLHYIFNASLKDPELGAVAMGQCRMGPSNLSDSISA